MSNQTNEREISVNLLIAIMEQGNFSHLVIRSCFDRFDLDKRQRSFITTLVLGTLEHLYEIDFIINSFSKVKVKKMKPLIRNVLRMSVYQFKYLDTIPQSAICNEAVNIVKSNHLTGLSGFTNGVLRSIFRSMDTIQYPSDPIEQLSILYSIPLFILKNWEKMYSIERITSICEGIQNRKPITIRTNTLLIDPLRLKEKLEVVGVIVTNHPYLPYVFSIENYDQIETLPGFSSGEFYIQDVSSMFVTEVSGIKQGDVCLDVCAAPGGKALHLASKLKGTGQVIARDLTSYKTSLIQDNINRSGYKNIQTEEFDATEFDPTWVQKADIVIADLPCSGYGIMGKKPDIRLFATEEKTKSLIELQAKILATVCSYVKVGGTLLYSTCTINADENENQVKNFLSTHPNFEISPIVDYLPKVLKSEVSELGTLQLLPGIHESDGFFITKLKRIF